MKKPRSPKQPVKASNIFVCCDTQFDSIDAIKKHLMEAHKLTELKGRKRMIMHLDCADSYHSQYEWTIGEVVFHQTTTNPRRKGDPMADHD